ncbi:unnamed protein product, partial [Iphiclides podalirius]
MDRDIQKSPTLVEFIDFLQKRALALETVDANGNQRHPSSSNSVRAVGVRASNILWRENPNTEIRCIQLTTVTYGLKSSSFLATRCLDELATVYKKDELPLASSILKNSTFVDDVLYADSDLNNTLEAKNQFD